MDARLRRLHKQTWLTASQVAEAIQAAALLPAGLSHLPARRRYVFSEMGMPGGVWDRGVREPTGSRTPFHRPDPKVQRCRLADQAQLFTYLRGCSWPWRDLDLSL